MVRGKKPTFSATCIICRHKIVNRLKVNSGGGDDAFDILRWKASSFESVLMLFGLPPEHPFLSIFLNSSKRKGRLCNECIQESSDAQFTFSQLKSLEVMMTKTRERLFKKLKSNYDSVPVSTMFNARLGDGDIQNNFENLTYDEVVKILFENFKGRKEEWPKPIYTSKWKHAQKSVEKISQNIHCQDSSSEPEDSRNRKEPETGHPLSKLDTNVKLELVEVKVPVSPTNITTEDVPVEVQLKEEDCVQYDNQSGGEDKDWLPSEAATSRMRIVQQRKKLTGKKRKIKGKGASDKPKMKSMFKCTRDASCSQAYGTMKELKEHIKTSHTTTPTLKCDLDGCTMMFHNEKRLENHKDRVHLKKESKEKPVEVCDICGMDVLRGDIKKHYYLRHFGMGKFSCEICSMDFNDPEEFEKHGQLHQNSTFPFSCVVCNNLYTNSLDLRTHVSSNHMSSGLKCPKCGIMKANEYLLQRHLKTHERSKTFVCECGKAFASKGYLSYHVEHSHTNVGKTYPCEICGKSFLHMKNAVRHLVTHKDDKPFKCKICSKSFNYSHLLKKHEEIHSNTKNYGCDICGKRFRQEQNLTQHMRSHKPKPEKSPQKKQVRKKPHSVIVNSGEDEVPIIMNVKGEAKHTPSVKTESVKVPIVNTTSGEAIPTTTPTLAGENHNGQFGTVHEIREIQINHGNMEPQTATVVFVTTDPTFQWIA